MIVRVYVFSESLMLKLFVDYLSSYPVYIPPIPDLQILSRNPFLVKRLSLYI
jgi:hypothetical protein